MSEVVIVRGYSRTLLTVFKLLSEDRWIREPGYIPGPSRGTNKQLHSSFWPRLRCSDPRIIG
jgi:hypothetical protein